MKVEVELNNINLLHAVIVTFDSLDINQTVFVNFNCAEKCYSEL